jgi:hypothetical protein
MGGLVMGVLSREASDSRSDSALMRWRSAMDVLHELQLQYALAKKNAEPGAARLKSELDAVGLACDLMLADAVIAQRRIGTPAGPAGSQRKL